MRWRHQTTPLRAQDAMQKRRKKDCTRVRGDGWHQGNRDLHTQQDWYTYDLTETVSAHTGPTRGQVRRDTSAETWNGGHRVPSLTKMLALISINLQRKKIIFFSGVSLGTRATLKAWRHEVEWMEKRGLSGRSWGRGNHDQNILYFKYKKKRWRISFLWYLIVLKAYG